jgi:hypothetical protein
LIRQYNCRLFITTNGLTGWDLFGCVGPFGEEDFNYVFGDQRPEEKRAGLDLSQGATDYLHLNGQEKVDWHFIDATDVPDGPWKKSLRKTK